MISYYIKTIRDKQVRTYDTFHVGGWISVVAPSDEEIGFLADSFDLEIGHLKDALDPNEVPRFESEGSVHYIITRVPVVADEEISTVPLLIVIHEKFILTASSRSLDLFDNLFSGKVKFNTTQRIKFFIQIFSLITERYNSVLTNLNRNIRHASRRTERITNRNIIELVNFENIINNFLNGMIQTNAVLNVMLTGRTLSLFREDRELVEDLFLATGQLNELLKSSLLHVRNIRDAYSAIMTNNLNRIIKFFTALTVILTIPTIIFSLYGMNVDLPLSDLPSAFHVVVGLTVFVSLSVYFYFRKKDWI